MSDKNKKKIKINTPKGRPLLTWVNKAPLEEVEGHPTQLVETFSPDKDQKILKTPEYDELEKNWHNLLFHGDNKEVLASLLELGFRGKVDLIYIDPPFASNKDYMRKVELRGLRDLGKIEEDSESIIQQTMYEDMWKRDEYFQFMYERLMLLKELLAETGSIYVHLDYNMVHYMRTLMDEVFGEDNFQNDIVWNYFMGASGSERWGRKHQNILFYSKSNNYHFDLDPVRVPYNPETIARARRGEARYDVDAEELEKSGKNPGDVWSDINPVQGNANERTSYATQKPESLLERIIKASSPQKGLVLDCFIGSGTTCATAQKLGRKWIGADINKGSIQVTSKRIQQLIKEQQKKLINGDISKRFGVYKVNNYDLKILNLEARELAIQQYGITATKTDKFFDGVRDSEELVKVIDFNHPLTLVDLQLISDELDKRKEEDRNVVVICLGRETKIDAWVEEWNKKQPYKDTRNKQRIRQFIIFDLKDKNFVSYEPSQAEIDIKRKDDNKAAIKVKSFISPTIIKRLELEPGLLRKKIPDFRSMIDVVLVDTDYNDEVFNITYSDVPEKDDDLVKGEYELEIPKKKTKVAVKIIDMLGEEVLVTEEV